jgi:surface-anchored protein
MNKTQVRSIASAAIVAATLLSGNQSRAAVLDVDHTDLSIGYDAASKVASLGIHYDPTDEDLDPATTTLRALSQAIEARPAGSNYNFIGVNPGDAYWRLPQSQSDNPEVLYLGFGADDIDDADGAHVKSWSPTDSRVSGPGKWFKVQMNSLTGPTGGKMSMWESTLSGPKVWMATSDGITTGDGGDSTYVLLGGDAHYNWGFTLPGIYEATFTVSGFDTDGSAVTSDPTTYTFDVQAVPEPASIGLLAGSGAILLGRRRARSRADMPA